MNDFITCSCQGVISSEIKYNKSLLSFRLKLLNCDESISVKLFDIDEATATAFQEKFNLGDRIYIEGEPRCDAFVNKRNFLIKGIYIAPTKVQWIEHTQLFEKKELILL